MAITLVTQDGRHELRFKVKVTTPLAKLIHTVSCGLPFPVGLMFDGGRLVPDSNPAIYCMEHGARVHIVFAGPGHRNRWTTSLLEAEHHTYDSTQLDKFRLMLLGCTKINPSFHKLPKDTKADMLWVFKKVSLVINNSWTHRCSHVHNQPTDTHDMINTHPS